MFSLGGLGFYQSLIPRQDGLGSVKAQEEKADFLMLGVQCLVAGVLCGQQEATSSQKQTLHNV